MPGWKKMMDEFYIEERIWAELAHVDILGEDRIKLKNVFAIRWLSMGEAVHSVMHWQCTLGEGGVTAGDPGAIGIHQQLSSFLPVALLHLQADALDATNHLSGLSQCRDISFSSLGERVHHYDQVHRTDNYGSQKTEQLQQENQFNNLRYKAIIKDLLQLKKIVCDDGTPVTEAEDPRIPSHIQQDHDFSDAIHHIRNAVCFEGKNASRQLL
ncbi:uncharacterized protein LOC118418251 [Branchiostoma floridae]|uniref:Uncharacterized protein LOC118418251 n=1 Tax=Branchiostoma floridae TaxID=7739 RepID=A0A9J7LBV3_BRAFL|nr:uncharacterized protein LOC118418251 [Branchiostoma floridae]